MTGLPFIAPHLRQGLRQKSLALFAARVAIVFGVASALAPAAFAELRVAGNPESVSIDAQNASIKEILDTLSKSFDVHVQSTANLEKQLTGTYEGSLPQVLKRVLEGYNVIIKTNKNRIEITVLATRNGTAVAGVSPASTVVLSQPVSVASPVPASQPAFATSAEQPSLAGPAGGDTTSPMLIPSTSPSSSMIVLAEGATPPLPSTSSQDPAQNAFPVAEPTNVAPPTPVAGSATTAFPIGKPTTSLPDAPAAGTVPPPVAGNNLK